MGHVYTASVGGVGVTVIQDFFQVLAVTNPVIIHSIRLAQSSDAGDAEAELLRVQISRSTMAVNGSGGTTPPPVAHSPASSAATTVVEANNTTQSTVTTVLLEDAFNVQAGWLYLPTPEERITVIPGQGLVVELPAAPTDSLTMSGSITFEEIR